MADAATPNGESTGTLAESAYRFGDLLALARHSWVRRMSALTSAAGFPGYRRSDTFLLRILSRGARPIGHVGDGLGISRQAARKLADGLVMRGYAEWGLDAADGRRRLVVLTELGHRYHRALDEASEALNGEIRRLTPCDVAAADSVLRTLLTYEDERLAESGVPRPSRRCDP